MCAGSPKCVDEGPKARNLLLHRQDDVEQHNRCDLQDHARDQRADQLSRILRLTHGGAVRLVDRLIERNLVDKQPSAIDRRVMTLALTPSGLQLRDKLLALRRDALAALLKRVSPEDLAPLERIAEIIVAALPENALSALTTCRYCE